MRVSRLVYLLLALAFFALPVRAEQEGGATVIYKTGEDFEDVVEAIKMAVVGRGLRVSGVLHVSDMLSRTGADLGFEKQVYLKAESVEFCSALISHLMAAADPSNLSMCPFTVGAYVLKDDPDQVYVAYRRPYLAGAAEEVTTEVADLLDSIAREAAE